MKHFMKKCLMMALTLVLISNTMVYAANQPDYAGHKPSTWAQEDIAELYETGILRDEAFVRFQDAITRQEFIYLAVRLYETINGEEVKVSSKIKFSDTNDVYALKGATLGITTGIGDGKFGPNQKITREQMASMLVKVMTLLDIDLDYEVLTYKDTDKISDYAKEPLAVASRFGIIKGYDNMINPKGDAKIEQALYIFKNMYDKLGVSAELETLNETQLKELYKGVVTYLDSDGYQDVTFFTGKGELYIPLYSFDKDLMLKFYDGTDYTGEMKVIGYNLAESAVKIQIDRTDLPYFDVSPLSSIEEGSAANLLLKSSEDGTILLVSTEVAAIDGSYIDFEYTNRIEAEGLALDAYGRVMATAYVYEDYSFGAKPYGVKGMPEVTPMTVTQAMKIFNLYKKDIPVNDFAVVTPGSYRINIDDVGADYYTVSYYNEGQLYYIDSASYDDRLKPDKNGNLYFTLNHDRGVYDFVVNGIWGNMEGSNNWSETYVLRSSNASKDSKLSLNMEEMDLILSQPRFDVISMSDYDLTFEDRINIETSELSIVSLYIDFDSFLYLADDFDGIEDDFNKAITAYGEALAKEYGKEVLVSLSIVGAADDPDSLIQGFADVDDRLVHGKHDNVRKEWVTDEESWFVSVTLSVYDTKNNTIENFND